MVNDEYTRNCAANKQPAKMVSKTSDDWRGGWVVALDFFFGWASAGGEGGSWYRNS